MSDDEWVDLNDEWPFHEMDVLLYGRSQHRERPPIVAAWYERHIDKPGWYTWDDVMTPINMTPTHFKYLKLPKEDDEDVA